MKKAIIMFLVRLRWWYFHVHPRYAKFTMDPEGKEAHFQDLRDGSIHSNLIWVDDPQPIDP